MAEISPKAVAYFKGLLSVQESQVLALSEPCGVALIYYKIVEIEPKYIPQFLLVAWFVLFCCCFSFFPLKFSQNGCKLGGISSAPSIPSCHVLPLVCFSLGQIRVSCCVSSVQARTDCSWLFYFWLCWFVAADNVKLLGDFETFWSL